MNQHNDHDFQQFRGQFDDAMTPGNSFQAKMEKMLQAEKPLEEERTSTVLASPPKQTSGTDLPTARRSHPLMIAAAVFTVFAVVVASVWVLSGDVLEGEYASAPSGIATLPADVSGMPGEDVQLTAEPFPAAGNGQQIHMVHDGMLITTHSGTDPEVSTARILAAQDVETGDVIWQLEDVDIGQLTISGNTLVGIRYHWETENPWTNATRSLAAIDLAMGTILWETEVSVPGSPDDRTPHSAPVVAGGAVVIAQSDGTAQAWDVTSGEVLWENTFDPGAGWETTVSIDDGETQKVTMKSVAAASWNDHIIVVNGDGGVHVLDPENGRPTASHQVVPTDGAENIVTRLELYSSPHGMVMVRDMVGHNDDRHSLTVIDPLVGEIIWEREVDGTIHVDISEDGTIAINSHVWKQYSAFLRFFGMGGYSTYQFTWLDGATGDVILQTDRGRLETSFVNLTDGEYGCTRTSPKEIICFDRNGTRHIIEIDAHADPVLADGVLYLSTEDGLYRVELP